MGMVPQSFIKPYLCHDEHAYPFIFSPYLEILNGWPLRQIEMQAVKIASIASIVKRPSPDESHPKWVLLPGRAALLSFIPRGRLECLCLLCLSFLCVFFLLQRTLQICPAFLGVYTSLLCQRQVVLKNWGCLAWNALCTFLSAIFLCFGFMCETARRDRKRDREGEKELERGVTAGQDDYNLYSHFYT